jgi:uncharacterized protein YqjF (DUF2071 family)
MDRYEAILSRTTNRYYPLPQKPWKYFQEWQDTLMIHWPVDPDAIGYRLPKGIDLDVFDGTAWVSLVIFTVDNLHIRHTAAPGFLRTFHEINLRTYVKKNGLPGIYMLSVETNNLLIVLASRLFIGIPYTKSHIRIDQNHMRSEHRSKGFCLDVEFVPHQNTTEKTRLDVWLTERHCVYRDVGNQWYRHDIHHAEWPLQSASIKNSRIEYSIGKLSTAHREPALVHFSPHLDVLLWGRKQV